MRLDKNLFSDDQAVTATAVSENIVRFPDAGNIGDGGSVRAYAQVTTDFATLTSLQVEYQTSPDDSTWTTVLAGEDIALADLVAGKVLLDVSVPKDATEYHRMRYVVTGSDATAGEVTAGLKWDS